LRARPESTQLECLSNASFLVKLLVLPANVRLDWKVIARFKHSCLFGHIISNEGKKFYNIDTCSLSWSAMLALMSIVEFILSAESDVLKRFPTLFQLCCSKLVRLDVILHFSPGPDVIKLVTSVLYKFS
jgi:hypothetical protein